jgi:hypothetical protein
VPEFGIGTLPSRQPDSPYRGYLGLLEAPVVPLGEGGLVCWPWAWYRGFGR